MLINEKGVSHPSMRPPFSVKLFQLIIIVYTSIKKNNYYLILTIINVFSLSATKVTFALPCNFLAFIVNAASPFSFVISLSDEIVITFLPALLIFAITSLPSTRQSSSPVSLTVILLLLFPLSFSCFLDGVIDSSSHIAGIGVAVTVTVGTGVGIGDRVGNGDGVIVGVIADGRVVVVVIVVVLVVVVVV